MTIPELHALYCERTNQQGLSCRFDRERLWFEWIKCGWGEWELKIVLTYLQKMIDAGKRNEGALKISNLIGQVDKFEEDLYEARRVLKARPISSAPKPRPAPVAMPEVEAENRVVAPISEATKAFMEEIARRKARKSTTP